YDFVSLTLQVVYNAYCKRKNERRDELVSSQISSPSEQIVGRDKLVPPPARIESVAPASALGKGETNSVCVAGAPLRTRQSPRLWPNLDFASPASEWSGCWHCLPPTALPADPLSRDRTPGNRPVEI